ncbi:MAG: HEAT repeat domain-containing protein [Coriobacteriia bacterium]|nr:HEAT repeat domain-containing protein [Coriobacteriia bacterium]
MAIEPEQVRTLENVLRALSTATRSLRLYPPSSPIPRQTIDSAIVALEEQFAAVPSPLKLAVAREGFAFEGEPVATAIVVTLEFANELRDHGVALIEIAPGTTADDLLRFLTVVSRAPDEVRAEGGIGAAIAAAGVFTVHLTDVQLVAVEQGGGAGGIGSEASFQAMADSPSQLNSWFGTASAAGKETLRSSIDHFVDVTGDYGQESLAEALSDSLATHEPANRDAFFTLALEPGETRQLAARVFPMMDAGDITKALLGGSFGSNMLALSSALVHLPLGDNADSVRREVIETLRATNRRTGEIEFLQRMLDVRESGAPEPALAQKDRTYRTLVQAGAVNDADVTRAREVTSAAAAMLDTAGVRTMLAMLDCQNAYEEYAADAESIAAMIPRLLERGEVALVANVFAELISRSARRVEWPELAARVQQALVVAITPESAGSFVRACLDDRSLIPAVRDVVALTGEQVHSAIAAEAVTHKAEGLEVAEELMGKRLIDLLIVLAPSVQWFQLGPIVERLGAEGGPRSMQTIEALLGRPEEQARRDIISALASASDPAVLPLLDKAMRDPSDEVSALAARALSKSTLEGAGHLLAKYLGELDVDNADFARAREVIGALARSHDSSADEALTKLASRRALIKRGHFIEIQQLAEQALSMRHRSGDAS